MKLQYDAVSSPNPVQKGFAGHPYGLRLRCPRCEDTLVEDEICNSCKFQMEEKDGIFLALAPDRLAYYAKFIADYEYIRAAEGRGSRDKSYYLALPYQDTTGNNSGQWKIRARSFDYLVDKILNPAGQGETILDLGAGNCWLSFQLAQLAYRPVAVDILTNSLDGLGAAIHYENELGFDIPRFQAELSCLPFQDEQFDAVIFNASFHYSEDYVATMREALRCVKPGGQVIICDTPWYTREQSGRQMVAERRAYFRDRFGTASESVKSLEFLTDDRLQNLEAILPIEWTVHRPWYGWKWAMRPWLARLRNRREPSQFCIYVTRKDGYQS
jgi:SAM-dependent methyltransferase